MTGEKMGCRDPRGFRDLMLAVAGGLQRVAMLWNANDCGMTLRYQASQAYAISVE